MPVFTGVLGQVGKVAMMFGGGAWRAKDNWRPLFFPEVCFAKNHISPIEQTTGHMSGGHTYNVRVCKPGVSAHLVMVKQIDDI